MPATRVNLNGINELDLNLAGSSTATTSAGVTTVTQTLTGIATQSGVQQEAYTYSADTGTANAYVITQNPAPTIVTGSEIVFKAANSNTGVSTVTVNGTTYPITKNGTSVLVGGEIVAGQIVTGKFDGTNFQIIVPAGITLQTNGTNNGSQSLLNLAAGSNVTMSDNGSGTVTISSTGGGAGSSWQFKTANYTATSGDLLICTGASGQTITMPASPSTGAMVAIRVALLGTWSNAVTVSGNGNNISSALFSSRASIRLGLDGQEVWFVWNGSAWYASSTQDGIVYLVPKVADFSWTNQGTATAVDTAQGLVMKDPNTGQPSQRILSKAVSGSFTNLLVKTEQSGLSGNYTNSGPVVLNSSGKYDIILDQQPQLFWVGRFNSATSNNSWPVNGVGNMGPIPWRQFTSDGTNLAVLIGKQPVALTQTYTETLASFLVSVTNVGLGTDGGGAGNGSVLFSYFDQW